MEYEIGDDPQGEPDGREDLRDSHSGRRPMFACVPPRRQANQPGRHTAVEQLGEIA